VRGIRVWAGLLALQRSVVEGIAPGHEGEVIVSARPSWRNARIEQLNTQIRLIPRQPFGFHSPAPLIAPAMLKLARLCPPLTR